MDRRGSGILNHITSLPSPYGIGDFGPWAYKFADFLFQTKQSFWQILPLNQIKPVHYVSPYSSISAFAGNIFFINPDSLAEDSFIEREDIERIPSFPRRYIDYATVIPYKENLFTRAYESFKKKKIIDDYEKFCLQHEDWLEDYSLFIILKEHFHGNVWSTWPQQLRDRQSDALKIVRMQFSEKIEKIKFLQYLFFKQWFSLKNYCNHKGIKIIGDIPMYVNYDSADVWTNPEIFKLSEIKEPTFVSGVPPDYFSQTGQLWGNPVYRWDVLKELGYSWWLKRMEHNLYLFDLVRIDHFIGFIAYWEIQAGEKTAINGKWVEGPGEDFFNILKNRFSSLPIIAEDLGTITQEVRDAMDRLGFPGMKVLLFAFGNNLPQNPYAPHNHVKNSVVYTGTHDNNTVRGWFEKEATEADKNRLFCYLGRKISAENVHWELIRLAMMSVANMVILPMQDILGLGENARMNHPSTSKGNWQWRLLPEQLTPSLTNKLLEITEIYGRT